MTRLTVLVLVVLLTIAGGSWLIVATRGDDHATTTGHGPSATTDAPSRTTVTSPSTPATTATSTATQDAPTRTPSRHSTAHARTAGAAQVARKALTVMYSFDTRHDATRRAAQRRATKWLTDDYAAVLKQPVQRQTSQWRAWARHNVRSHPTLTRIRTIGGWETDDSHPHARLISFKVTLRLRGKNGWHNELTRYATAACIRSHGHWRVNEVHFQ